MSDSEPGRLVSPDQLLKAGQEQMLGGREVATLEDRFLILNFVASNVASGLEGSVLRLFSHIYGWHEDGVTDEDCANIAKFQAERKS